MNRRLAATAYFRDPLQNHTEFMSSSTQLCLNLFHVDHRSRIRNFRTAGERGAALVKVSEDP